MSKPELCKLIGSRMYAIEPKRSDADCPFCERPSTVALGDPRSYGFRRKSHHRHVFVCYEKELAKIGYLRGKYIAKQRLHVLIRIKIPEVSPKKGWPLNAHWTYVCEENDIRAFSSRSEAPIVTDYERSSLRRIKQTYR